MSIFTRLTVIGSSRKAEIVVPNDESISTVLVRIAELLDEPTASLARPLALTRTTGEQLDLSSTLTLQGVSDGELIRLIRADDAPPPPEVSDVTDVVASEREGHPALWGPQHRRRMAAGAIAVGTGALGAMLLLSPLVPSADWALVWAFLGLLVCSVGTGLGRLRWAATVFLSAALGLVPALALALIGIAALPASSPLLTFPLMLAFLAWLAIGAGFGIALRLRAALWGSAVGLLASALPLILLWSGMPAEGAAAISGVVTVFGLGLLPWYAMSASGLTGLDDQVIEGAFTQRDRVQCTLAQAYSTLGWSTVALALPIAVSIVALFSSTSAWSLWLGLAITLVTLLRTRAFPLAGQAAVLWAASIAAIAVSLFTQSAFPIEISVAVAAALIVAVAIVGASAPPAHVRARLRRAGDLVEMLAAVAMVPLLLGAFGIYADLLGTFTR